MNADGNASPKGAAKPGTKRMGKTMHAAAIVEAAAPKENAPLDRAGPAVADSQTGTRPASYP